MSMRSSGVVARSRGGQERNVGEVGRGCGARGADLGGDEAGDKRGWCSASERDGAGRWRRTPWRALMTDEDSSATNPATLILA